MHVCVANYPDIATDHRNCEAYARFAALRGDDASANSPERSEPPGELVFDADFFVGAACELGVRRELAAQESALHDW